MPKGTYYNFCSSYEYTIPYDLFFFISSTIVIPIKSKLWIYCYYFVELVNAETQTKGFCEATLLKNLRVQTYYKKGSD